MFRYKHSADLTEGDLSMSAREAVNVIRQRTGVEMPEFPVGLSEAEFEKKYMNERKVELAFEGHRFWDVRRWMKGDELKQISTMTITKNEDESFTYTREVKERKWEDKMYWFPIANTERIINPNLSQNPGW